MHNPLSPLLFFFFGVCWFAGVYTFENMFFSSVCVRACVPVCVHKGTCAHACARLRLRAKKGCDLSSTPPFIWFIVLIPRLVVLRIVMYTYNRMCVVCLRLARKQNDGYNFKVRGVVRVRMISDIIIMNYELLREITYNLPKAINYIKSITLAGPRQQKKPMRHRRLL